MAALDKNGNGIVEQQEFVSLLEDAMASGVTMKTGLIGLPNPSKQDAAPKTDNKTLLDTVRPQDRLNSKQVIEYLNKLLEVDKRLGETPEDDIEKLFDKIQKWKLKAGDLDAQEKMITKKLKPVEPLQVHNMKTALELLTRIKGEIKLDDDEVSVILYSSLDRDWFTNLIIMQGDFLKWFNMNFEGET